MKQRLSIAISLLANPDFLVLDEPINGLDPSGIKEIRELLIRLNTENDITILISSHILGELAKVATKYGIIADGYLVDEFTADELMKRCKKCVSIETTQPDKSALVLEQEGLSSDYQVFPQGNIQIFDNFDSVKINKVLNDHDIPVSSIGISGNDIEAYIVNLMGGKNA